MKKFPVISQNGRVYEVKFFQWRLRDGYTFVDIYERKPSIFGIMRNVRVNNKNRWSAKSFDLHEWNYDYVEMAKRAIQDYEDSIAGRLEKERLQAEMLAKFNAWDGDCNETV